MTDVSKNDLHLEPGKAYLTKAGKVVIIIHDYVPTGFYITEEDYVYLYVGDDCVKYNSSGGDGLEIHGSDFDPIVSEATADDVITYTVRNAMKKHPLKMFDYLKVWGEHVFGPTTPSRIVERANEEMSELVLEAAGNEWTDKVVEEAADVVIILTRAPGLADAIVRKMEKNINRKWALRGDGTGYHIPDPQ